MVHERVACCGLDCNGCPIRWATLEEDPNKRAKMRTAIAQFGREHYGVEMKAGDITDCDGCRAKTGRLFSGCATCKIRECAKQKKVESCAHCSEYACEKLQTFFVSDPGAKMHLEFIRSVV